MNKFQEYWSGTKFRCAKTGVEITISENCQEGDFISFGESFVDLGRFDYVNNTPFYCRYGGYVEEVK